jgi:hypothetical protein
MSHLQDACRHLPEWMREATSMLKCSRLHDWLISLQNFRLRLPVPPWGGVTAAAGGTAACAGWLQSMMYGRNICGTSRR